MHGRIFLLVLGLSLVCVRSSSVVAVYAQGDFKGQLQVGMVSFGTLSGKTATVTYSLIVSPNQYFALDLDNPSGDVTVVMSSRDGRLSRSIGCFYKRATHISEVSPAGGGQYLVEVRRCISEISDSTYQLRVSQTYDAKDRDIARVIAERTEQEADLLLSDFQSDRSKTVSE